MVHSDVPQLGRPVWPVNFRHPVVTPPIREQSRVVETENVDVRPMNEIVRHYADISAEMVRADDADSLWVVLIQGLDERFRPVGRDELCVVVDAVEIVDVVEVGLHHGVVLRPCRISGVRAPDEVERRLDASRGAAQELDGGGEDAAEGGQQGSVLAENGVRLVVGEVESVAELRTGRLAERRQEIPEYVRISRPCCSPLCRRL